MKTKTKFSKMTAAQKRVAIARDVLKQIKLKTTKIKLGRYWAIVTNKSFVGRACLAGKTIKCECCAAGAAMLSGIRLFNKESVEKVNGSSNAFAQDNRWFSRQQMALIETAFEQLGNRLMENEVPDESRWAADKFYNRWKNPATRAVKIFENIIANHGTFIP